MTRLAAASLSALRLEQVWGHRGRPADDQWWNVSLVGPLGVRETYGDLALREGAAGADHVMDGVGG